MSEANNGEINKQVLSFLDKELEAKIDKTRQVLKFSEVSPAHSSDITPSISPNSAISSDIKQRQSN